MTLRCRHLADDLVLATVVMYKHPVLESPQGDFSQVIEPSGNEILPVALLRAVKESSRARCCFVEIGWRGEGMRIRVLVESRTGKTEFKTELAGGRCLAMDTDEKTEKTARRSRDLRFPFQDHPVETFFQCA